MEYRAISERDPEFFNCDVQLEHAISFNHISVFVSVNSNS
jgi:hypothetical protein